LAVLALLAVNGFFVAAEYALVAVRLSRVRQLAARGVLRAKIVLDLLGDLDRAISGVQLGVTLASLGLGAIVSQAGRISDAMVLAAARTLAGEVSAERLQAGALYPPISNLRSVSRAITLAVAREAIRSGLASPVEDLEAEVDAAMWWPAYAPYVRA